MQPPLLDSESVQLGNRLVHRRSPQLHAFVQAVGLILLLTEEHGHHRHKIGTARHFSVQSSPHWIRFLPHRGIKRWHLSQFRHPDETLKFSRPVFALRVVATA